VGPTGLYSLVPKSCSLRVIRAAIDFFNIPVWGDAYRWQFFKKLLNGTSSTPTGPDLGLAVVESFFQHLNLVRVKTQQIGSKLRLHRAHTSGREEVQ
jgi:hypothetical protein